MVTALLAAPLFWGCIATIGLVATALAKATEPFDPHAFDREGDS